MSVRIHPTAIVDAGAQLDDGVTVGPYAIVGGGAKVGRDTAIGPHVVLDGLVTIGERCTFTGQSSIGTAPQDLKYKGSPTRLDIGDDNIVREFVTMNRATEHGGGTTRVGNHGMFMAYAHVAHDCIVGDHVVMANAATLAGHVTIEDHAIVGGLVAIHQFVRIGESAILGGGAMVTLDVIPYGMAAGDRAAMQGLNVIGIRRRGFSTETIQALRAAYRTIFRSGMRLQDALEALRADAEGEPRVEHLIRFIEGSQRGICR
ncbi:MAG TPA: acyl-ACP--UDP-N-acetylglucosamine O-acyltransferase [Candidatus Limnocylindrales bacterium]|nr:acyl-ACP--UDP-N-acetylglucosamine O-acyltransferase [Candidatus Limnocylindrales bacterium]